MYLTANDAGEVGLLWRKDVEFGLVGSFPLILSTHLQGESIVITDVELFTIAADIQRTEISTYNRSLNMDLYPITK